MDVSRELQHRIVASLARGRSTQLTASRLRLSEGLVVEVGSRFGWPHLGKLAEAADVLRQPRSTITAQPPVEETPVNNEPSRGPQSDGLSAGERDACRRWATASGVPVGSVGRLRQTVVEAWTSAGRPDVPDVPVPDDSTPTDLPAFMSDPQLDALDEVMDDAASRAERTMVARDVMDVSGDPTAALEPDLWALLDEVRGHRLAALHAWINGLDGLTAHARRLLAELEPK